MNKKIKRKKSRIPSHAQCVFKGTIFDVYQWNQKMFDGSVQVFEKLKRPDTVSIIATVGKKIVLQNQRQPDTGYFLSLPGGRVDNGEKPLYAAKRELLEESGYASRQWKLFMVMFPYNKIEWKSYVYIARDCVQAGELRLDSGEKIKNSLISFDEFLLLSDNAKFRGRDLVIFLMQCRLHPEKREKLYKELFEF